MNQDRKLVLISDWTRLPR